MSAIRASTDALSADKGMKEGRIYIEKNGCTLGRRGNVESRESNKGKLRVYAALSREYTVYY